MSSIDQNLNFITNFKNNLQGHHEALVSDFMEDEIRSVNEAKFIIDFIAYLYEKAAKTFQDYPTLASLFENKFGPLKDLATEDTLVDIAFMDEYVYPNNDQFGFYVDEKFSDELVSSHRDFIDDWLAEKVDRHQKTEKFLEENFTLQVVQKNLECQCVGCVADFRTRVREKMLQDQKKLIDDAVEILEDKVLVKKIDQISDDVFQLRKKIDKNYHLIRNKLRKGSLNKLSNEVKSYFDERFDSNSDLAKAYKEKIKAYCNSVLVEEDIKPDMVTEIEFQRFFDQLHTNLWKPARYIRREFKKLVNSIMTFKRKDISATILKDYLGQFWLHSDARRMNRKIIYHMGPTNSGKTYHAINALCEAKKGCYLAPLRLLASELYDTMNSKDVKTSLLTGEEVIDVEGCTHYSSTIEMAKLNEYFDCCVIDEIQMITDAQRGWAWTRALVNLQSPEIHLCGDPSVLELVKKILKLTGDELEIKEYTRMTELKVQQTPIKLPALERNDALIVFSRRNALKYKNDLEKLGFKVSIVYGRLSPEVRREQARKFDEGETDIMVSTDAIAMGMNLPVQRIVFSTLSKFINSKEYILNDSEIKQIAGRAGRYQRFPVGYVTCLEKVNEGIEMLNEAISTDLEQKTRGMVGPDLDIYRRVNNALVDNGLEGLSLSEFLRLFNTMTFEKPFYCVELKEMIEVAEMIEDIDRDNKLTMAEKFGFTCAPVNLGLMEHVQYFMQIASEYVAGKNILNVEIDEDSDNIDYLETAIKCVELYQWLSRHFDNKGFVFDDHSLLHNKGQAIEKLNELLSERLHKHCSSCGVKMSPDFRFNICEKCFGEKRFRRRPSKKFGSSRSDGGKSSGGKRKGKSSGGSKKHAGSSFKKGKKKKSGGSKASKLTKYR